MARTQKKQEITLESFVALVRQWKYTMHRYQRFGKPETLEKCIELERKVDEVIKEVTGRQTLIPF